jgi:hypothetical protein
MTFHIFLNIFCSKKQHKKEKRELKIHASPQIILIFALKPGVLGSALLENISAAAINCNNEREILDVKPFNRLAAQILKSNNLARLYAARRKRAAASYRA